MQQQRSVALCPMAANLNPKPIICQGSASTDQLQSARWRRSWIRGFHLAELALKGGSSNSEPRHVIICPSCTSPAEAAPAPGRNPAALNVSDVAASLTRIQVRGRFDMHCKEARYLRIMYGFEHSAPSRSSARQEWSHQQLCHEGRSARLHCTVGQEHGLRAESPPVSRAVKD